MLKKTAVAVVVLLWCIGFASAEEKLGVQIYPGAKYDDAMTRSMIVSPTMSGYVYRTDDSIAKVSDFYRKQGLVSVQVGGGSKETARFKKFDTNTDVVIKSPWKDSRTGAMMKDTLIMVLKDQN